jgi:tRNA 2-thiouridine synthesizing protein A
MAEKDNIKPKILVDCVGLYCPIPIFNTTTEMEKIEPGDVLEMVTGDQAAVQDIPRWAKRAGHRLVKLSQVGEEYHFLIQKGN